MIIDLSIGYYALRNGPGTLSEIESGHLIPYMIVDIIIVIISYYQYFRFVAKRELYLKSIKNLRQHNWKQIIVNLSNNGEVEKAINLFKSLNFTDTYYKDFLAGYITASNKI
jgi:hypothetical protein